MDKQIHGKTDEEVTGAGKVSFLSSKSPKVSMWTLLSLYLSVLLESVFPVWTLLVKRREILMPQHTMTF